MAPTPRAIRIYYHYDSGSLNATHKRYFHKKIQKSAPVPVIPDRSGFWFELRDDRDKTLYWRPMFQPIRYTVEVSDGSTGFVRRANRAQFGWFDVVVPLLPDGKDVVLFSSPLNSSDDDQVATELHRVAIDSVVAGRRP